MRSHAVSLLAATATANDSGTSNAIPVDVRALVYRVALQSGDRNAYHAVKYDYLRVRFPPYLSLLLASTMLEVCVWHATGAVLHCTA